jgi:hypothetical protein
MTQPAPTEAPIGSARRYTVIGGLLGAAQPLLCASMALWMKADGTSAGEASNPLVAGVLLGWRSVIPCAVLAATVGWLTHSAYVKFGRDSVIPIVLTYAFLSTALLLFLFLSPE